VFRRRRRYGARASFVAAASAIMIAGAAAAAFVASSRPGAAGPSELSLRAGRVQRTATGSGAIAGPWLPNKLTVEAIQALGGRVTKADVLGKGVPAAGLERELLELSRASGAGLRVNDRGELLYEFPKDLFSVISSKNAAAQLQQAWEAATPWLSYAGRILFGVSLLVLVAVLYSAVLILLSSNTRDDRDDRDRDRGGGGGFMGGNNFAMWFGEDIFWWLIPRPYGYYNSYGGGLYGELYSQPP
ncbi:unnamed protein product, partial [Polarella glacialis]